MQFCLYRMKFKNSLKYDAHVDYDYDEEDVLGVSWLQLFISSLHIFVYIVNITLPP